MRKTFMDGRFDEWEAYVTAGQPGGDRAARIVFVCISTPTREPRFVNHPSGDPAEAEHELYHLDEPALIDMFDRSEPLP